MDAVAIIPARLGSTRFPGKVLADRTGWPLIRHVYEAAVRSGSLSRVVVATDDERVLAAVRAFGGEGVMTGGHHQNGTSRLAEAAAALGLGERQVIVNVQGDEPELGAAAIDAGVRALLDGEAAFGADIGTVAVPFGDGEDAADPNAVKVVTDLRGAALYFSRARIPFDRDGRGREEGDDARALRHVGLYAYRRAFLEAYAAMPSTALERVEQLEQLRALQHGHPIAVSVCGAADVGGGGIDTAEQYEAFVRRWGASRSC